MTDDLILKGVDIGAGTQLQIGSFALGISVFKGLFVRISHIIQIDLITAFQCDRSVCAMQRMILQSLLNIRLYIFVRILQISQRKTDVVIIGN